MIHYEQEAGELLWKYIQEVRRAENPEAVNFIVRTPVDPSEMASMLALTDALQESLRIEAPAVSGQKLARERLQEALYTERPPAASPRFPAISGWKRLLVPLRRETALVMILLLLTLGAVSAWTAVWKSIFCPPPVADVPPATAPPRSAMIHANRENCKTPDDK